LKGKLFNDTTWVHATFEDTFNSLFPPFQCGSTTFIMHTSPAATHSPSSSEEVDVVLSYISANNRCDITAVLAHLDGDIKVIGPSGGFSNSKT